jgi:copper chaperone
MESLKFKTNLKCGGCIAAIKPELDKLEGLGQWNVDLTVPDRILEVETSPDKAASILEAVKKAGYEISQL